VGKKILISSVIGMTTIIVVLFVAIFTFNLNKYKPQIEQKVYETTGKELKINGKIGFSLSPFGISAKDIIIKNPKGFSKNNMLKVQKAGISLQIIPLLHKQLKINYIEFANVDLLVEKSKKGVLNLAIEKKSQKNIKKSKQKSNKENTLPKINVNKILVKNVNIVYKDMQTKMETKINGLDLTINNIAINGKDIFKTLSLKGLLFINNIKYNKYLLTNISANFKIKNEIATINPMKFSMFNSNIIGKLVYNIQNKKPLISIEEHIAKIDLKELSKEFIKNKKVSLDGYAKADIKLSMIGTSLKDIEKTLNGTSYIQGDNLGIKGIDLNKIVDNYNNLKKINLKDAGAFLLAGPIGVAITKGANGAQAAIGFKGGTTAIRKLVINTPVKNGIVTLEDVALATKKHIIALKGKINLPKESFVNVSAGILNSKRCAIFIQKINGTFSNPKINISKVATSVVTGIAKSLFAQFGRVLPKTKKSSKCKVFYQGSIK